MDINRISITSREREQWLDNDEGLHAWWKATGKLKRAFIRENRDKIDRVIRAIVSGEERAHFLAYDEADRFDRVLDPGAFR